MSDIRNHLTPEKLKEWDAATDVGRLSLLIDLTTEAMKPLGADFQAIYDTRRRKPE